MLINELKQEIEYLTNMQLKYKNQHHFDGYLQATYEAIGYVCESVNKKISWLIELLQTDGIDALDKIDDVIQWMNYRIIHFKEIEKSSFYYNTYNKTCEIWYEDLLYRFRKLINKVIEDAK